MSYTHESASKDDFLAAVEDAQATHGTRWTLGKGQPPPWSIEVDTWGEPCCLVDRASKTSTAYEPDYSWRKPRAPPPKPPAAAAPCAARKPKVLDSRGTASVRNFFK